MKFKEFLENGVKRFDMRLEDDQIKNFEKYKDMLTEWNKKINLTGITDDEGIAIKHFTDSIAPVEKLNAYMPVGCSMIDIGSGAGFPGIPLKIVRPDMDVVLLDSLAKRLKFLDEVISKTGLKNIKTVHYRAEDGARQEDLRENFDVAVARAVAPLGVLLEYCIPYIKKGGYFFAFKSSRLNEEINDAARAFKEMGCTLEDIVDFSIYTSGDGKMERSVAIIKKVSNTRKIYPRKAGTPGKNPI